MDADKTFYPRLFKYPFDVHFRHFSRYFNVIKLIDTLGRGERWLDCACGSGYGTHLLSEFCDEITGFDIDSEAIAYARRRYETENCIFASEPAEILPNHYDCIISIETIEHVSRNEAGELLQLMKNWLKETGVLAITTPIVPTSNPNPSNPYHLYEYDMEEFCDLLKQSGFHIEHIETERVTFTDNETKDQAMFRCKVRK